VCCVGKVDGSNHSDKEGIFGQVGLRRERKDMHYEMIKSQDLSAMMSFSFIIYSACTRDPTQEGGVEGPGSCGHPYSHHVAATDFAAQSNTCYNQCCSCLLIIAACGGSLKDIGPKVPQYLY